MTDQSLLARIAAKYDDPSSSVISAAYRHIRWKIRLFVRQILFPLTTKYPDIYRYYIAIRRQLQSDRYTDADPLKVIWVDPTRITKTCEDNFGRPLKRGAVYSGDWDQNTGQFASRKVPRQVYSYFEDDQSISEEVQAKVDRLADAIQREGYLTQRELLNKNTERTKSANNDPVPTALNEITVNIGRDGELLWRTYGQHRLAVAKMLGVEKVPVLVCVRHKQWQAIRDAFRQAKRYEELPADLRAHSDHPDLADLINKTVTGHEVSREH